MNSSKLFKLGLVMILAGLVLAFIGTIIPLLKFKQDGSGVSITTGACILIGFIPICFGAGDFPVHLLLIVVSMSLLLVLLSVLFSRHIFKGARRGDPQSHEI
ncbi:MAG: hypothetical protein QXK88_03100 [Desulfurococcaceae archaeon]